MAKARFLLGGAAVILIVAFGLYWLGPGKTALTALGFQVDAPQYPAAYADAATIDWADLIPAGEAAVQERLPDGSLPRGIVLHGQLGPQTPLPVGDPSIPLSALAQTLGGFNNLDAPPRRMADAYGGIGNLKGLQPPGVEIREDLDGKVIKMAGFVTPLAFEGTRISEFLLVPFVGACIHVPPPPANQIVYVSGVKGYTPTGGLLYPVWVTGTLKAAPIDTNLANVGYRLEGPKVEPYQADPGSKVPISGY
jgi:hypothetical protein